MKNWNEQSVCGLAADVRLAGELLESHGLRALTATQSWKTGPRSANLQPHGGWRHEEIIHVNGSVEVVPIPSDTVGEADTSLFGVPIQGVDSDERYTPSWVFDGLGLAFDLDPASPIGGGDCVPAATKFTREDDGLTLEWFGLVWCNPPFSDATRWADRFRAHGNGVLLGPVANARWWIDLARAADRLWLCRDFAFVHPTHAGRRSSMPLAFVAMGEQSSVALSGLAQSGRHDGVLVAREAA